MKRFQATGFSEMADNLYLAFQHQNYPQALEFVALQRSLEHSWWRVTTDCLSALSTLRTHAASAAPSAETAWPDAFGAPVALVQSSTYGCHCMVLGRRRLRSAGD